jgi:hypothetical protein
MSRRFPPPWTVVVRLPGGSKVIDANGQSLAYFYARENDHDANTAGVLTMDEARSWRVISPSYQRCLQRTAEGLRLPAWQ